MDIDAIKSRLNQLQNTTTNSFWKPQPGKTQITIVPYKFNKANPFSELFFHYSLVPNKTVLSPLSFGRPDPVQYEDETGPFSYDVAKASVEKVLAEYSA